MGVHLNLDPRPVRGHGRRRRRLLLALPVGITFCLAVAAVLGAYAEEGSRPTSSPPSTVGGGAYTVSSVSSVSPVVPVVTTGTAVPSPPATPPSLAGKGAGEPDRFTEQPNPPSLAGAYSGSVTTAVMALLSYQDWVHSHPDPGLVAKYMVPGTSAYQTDRQLVDDLAERGWRAGSAPGGVGPMAVTSPPHLVRTADHKAVIVSGHTVLSPAIVTVVLNSQASSYVDSAGQVAAYAAGGGKTAYSIVLVQDADGQWRIYSMEALGSPGGVGS